MTVVRKPRRWRWALYAAGLIGGVAAFGAWHLNSVQPARSHALAAYLRTVAPTGGPPGISGAALFAYGDFGSIDLDTLETSAMPWPVLAAALALAETGGKPELVAPGHVETQLRRFGFLFPKAIAGQLGLALAPMVPPAPLGLVVGTIERTVPPLRVSAVNIGCASCHAGPDYRADGTPDPDVAVLGRPNTGLDLEAYTRGAYVALKAAFADEAGLRAAMRRLFPEMSAREQITLRWIVLPRARRQLAAIAAGLDRALPFNNGAPGLTNGVAALKFRLGVKPADRLNDDAGFVSVPDLGLRPFRSALLVDGAYAPRGEPRFRPISADEAAARAPATLAGIASFFMVPTTGVSPRRAEAAIPELTAVIRFLARDVTPRFPGPIDRERAAAGRDVYARACASCHGTYDRSLDVPRLLVFPNWAGDVGTDRSRLEVFDATLEAAVDRTGHGQRLMDAAMTGRMAAPLLSALWASAPYMTNGSIPTLRHLLEPATRPVRFMTGGHRLDLARVGIAGELSADGTWRYPAGYSPYSTPQLIDTTRRGFSNSGHEAEVRDLSASERDALLEYLKVL